VHRSDHHRRDTAAWRLGVLVDSYGPLLVGSVVILILAIMGWFASGEPY
jgi:hypothetical protein